MAHASQICLSLPLSFSRDRIVCISKTHPSRALGATTYTKKCATTRNPHYANGQIIPGLCGSRHICITNRPGLHCTASRDIVRCSKSIKFGDGNRVSCAIVHEKLSSCDSVCNNIHLLSGLMVHQTLWQHTYAQGPQHSGALRPNMHPMRKEATTNDVFWPI